MDSVSVIMLVAIALLAVLLVFLAVAETAINRISKPKAEALAEQHGKRGKALLEMVRAPEGFMNPVLVTVNLAQTGQAFLTSLLVARLSDAWWAPVLAFVVNVVVFFVFAESLPKTWAVISSERAALAVARPTLLLVRFTPLRLLSRGLIGLTNIVFPGKGLKQGPFVSEREFLGIVEQAAEGEVIEHEERELIESVIEFGDTVAREVMVPRTDMVTVSASDTVTDALTTMIEKGYSRVPVTGEGIDDVVGIAYTKDLVRRERLGHGQEAVGLHIRAAKFVPETKHVAPLMREMQLDRQHMAILVDEYGGIAGLVTLEDLIEELVGEIVDEYDVEVPEVEHLPGGDLSVDGGLDIDELAELLGVELPNEDWDTVGGFVFGMLGRVPNEGEWVEHGGHRFVAERMDGRRISRVRISPVGGADDERAEEPARSNRA